MSTPATRPPLGTLAVVIAGPSRQSPGRASVTASRGAAAAVGWSSLHRQAELAGQQQGAGAEQRQVLAAAAVDDAGLARQRAEAAARRPRRGSPSSHGSPRAVTEPWTTMWRTSRMPIRFGDGGAERAAGGARDAQGGRVAVAGRRRPARGGSWSPGGRPRPRRAGSPGALATVSRQPKRPQWHSAPSGSTTTWPISPAPSPSPPNSSPSRTRPAPMPRPTLMATRLVGRSSPLEQERGEGRGPGCRWRRSSGGRSGRARSVGERQVLPVEVDRPADRAVGVDDARGADADAEDRARAPRGWTSSISSWTRARASSPSRPSRSRVRRFVSSPRRFARAAVNVRSPRSRVIDGAGVVSRATRVGCLPPVLGPRPTSLGQALALEVRDQLADAGAGQAGEAGDVGARDRAEVVERAQDQAGVVGPGLRVGRLGRDTRCVPCAGAGLLRRRPCLLRSWSRAVSPPKPETPRRHFVQRVGKACRAGC